MTMEVDGNTGTNTNYVFIKCVPIVFLWRVFCTGLYFNELVMEYLVIEICCRSTL